MKRDLINHDTCDREAGKAVRLPMPPMPGKRKVAIAIGIAAVAAVMQLTHASPADTAAPTQLPGVEAVLALEPEMVVIPAGSFMMGDSEHVHEQPVHRVSLGRFELGKYEVTQGLWKAVMGSNPSRFSECGDNCPVEQVSWDDAQAFIKKLNQKTGKSFRLPSEAEWEYAARAGSTTKYWWGDVASHEYANYGKEECCEGLAQGRDQWEHTAPVGQFPANSFGLYDMHANIKEWVQDCYEDNYSKGQPIDGTAHRGDDSTCTHRVQRGGSWSGSPQYHRSAMRYWIRPNARFHNMGLRLARTVP